MWWVEKVKIKEDEPRVHIALRNPKPNGKKQLIFRIGLFRFIPEHILRNAKFQLVNGYISHRYVNLVYRLTSF